MSNSVPRSASITLTFAPTTIAPEAAFTVPAITPVSFCAQALPQESKSARRNQATRKLVVVLLSECSSRLEGLAKPDRKHSGSLITDTPPTKLGPNLWILG